MAKRKCERPLVALLPPCKRPQCELPVCLRSCAPHTLQQGSAKRRRKAEHVTSPDREREPQSDGTAAASHPPSKKPRLSESPDRGAAPAFQCQKDEAFQEYNSFHFWRTPLPDIDLSELADGACDDRAAMSTDLDVPEEMDN